MIVYLDIVFLENVVMNYIILIATSLISKNRIKLIPLFLASIIGALYAILNFILPMNTLENIFFKIFISIVMIKISFVDLKIRKFLTALIMFYLTSLTFGGASFMVMFLNIKNEVMYGALLGFVLIFIVSKTIKKRIIDTNLFCELEIFYDGKSSKIKTLVDTGNLLKEPISNEDVIIVEKESLKTFINDKVLREIKNIINGNLLGDVDEEIYRYKFKVIPFTSLGNDNGILLGFKPDYIKVYSDDEEMVKNDIFVGIYDGKLSSVNAYSSLIGVNILKGEDVNEYSTIG